VSTDRPGRDRSDHVGTDVEYCCRMIDPFYRASSFVSITLLDFRNKVSRILSD
jgi:hypothetical protein